MCAAMGNSQSVARSCPGRKWVLGGLMLLLALMWTVTETLPVLLEAEHSLVQVVWVRYGVHILFMLLVLAPREGLAALRTRRPALQVGRGLLMLAMPAAFIAAIGRVAMNEMLAVFWLSPLLLLALAAMLQHDRPPAAIWAAAAGCTLGAALILRPGLGVLAAAPYGLVMGISFSLYVVLTRTLRSERTATNLLYSALTVFVPLSFFAPRFWSPLSRHDALVLAGVGLAGLVVLWAIDRATEIASISRLAPLVALQLVLYDVVSPLVWGTWPARLALAGAALIVVCASAGLWLPPEDGAVQSPEPAQTRP